MWIVRYNFIRPAPNSLINILFHVHLFVTPSLPLSGLRRFGVDSALQRVHPLRYFVCFRFTRRYQDAVADVPILQSPQGNRIPGISIPSPVPKAASADLSEVFHRIVLISDGNGRARIGQAECRAGTVFKFDFELGLGLMNGFYFTPWRYRCRSGCLDLHA